MATAPVALAEPLSGYGTTTPAPPTTTTPHPTTSPPETTQEPKPTAKTHITETSPSTSEEVTRPEEKDERGGVAPTVETERVAPARTLPYTGFDIPTELALGLLLIAGGCTLLLVQRRRKAARWLRYTRIVRAR